MIRTILARMKQGFHTIRFPSKTIQLSSRYQGKPQLDSTLPLASFNESIQVCPTEAIHSDSQKIQLDMGRCIFCGACEKACLQKGISFTKDYSMATSTRDQLILSSRPKEKFKASPKISFLFGKSLKLRQVSAGGCNACELDINVLNTLVFDLSRFGIQFVASPRHADGILVTGPVTENMKRALQKTHDAVSHPKVVIAVGACAISGGIYRDHPETNNGVDSLFPVDLYIPGCPPHPFTILDGLLKFLNRI